MIIDRRHSQISVTCRNTIDQLRVVWTLRHDNPGVDRLLAIDKRHAAGLLDTAVATGAVLVQDGPNLSIEVDGGASSRAATIRAATGGGCRKLVGSAGHPAECQEPDGQHQSHIASHVESHGVPTPPGSLDLSPGRIFAE